jgi:hypothetical protein
MAAVATVFEFRDSKQDYAGTKKFDGSVEARPKFIEDFKQVSKAKNMLAWLISQEIVKVRLIPGDFLEGYEMDITRQARPPRRPRKENADDGEYEAPRARPREEDADDGEYEAFNDPERQRARWASMEGIVTPDEPEEYSPSEISWGGECHWSVKGLPLMSDEEHNAIWLSHLRELEEEAESDLDTEVEEGSEAEPEANLPVSFGGYDLSEEETLDEPPPSEWKFPEAEWQEESGCYEWSLQDECTAQMGVGPPEVPCEWGWSPSVIAVEIEPRHAKDGHLLIDMQTNEEIELVHDQMGVKQPERPPCDYMMDEKTAEGHISSPDGHLLTSQGDLLTDEDHLITADSDIQTSDEVKMVAYQKSFLEGHPPKTSEGGPRLGVLH